MGVLLGSLGLVLTLRPAPTPVGHPSTRGRDPCPALDFKLARWNSLKFSVRPRPLSLPWEELPLGPGVQNEAEQPGVHTHHVGAGLSLPAAQTRPSAASRSAQQASPRGHRGCTFPEPPHRGSVPMGVSAIPDPCVRPTSPPVLCLPSLHPRPWTVV